MSALPDERFDPGFSRRLPLALGAVLRASSLEGVVAAICREADCACPDGFARIEQTGLDSAEAAAPDPSSLRRTDEGIELTVPLATHGTSLGELTVERRGADAWITGREREQIRTYAELVTPALYAQLARHELRRMALTDPLTGVANRRSLMADLERLEREGAGVRLLFVDAHRLGAVNRDLGHEAGDQLIAALGRAVVAAVGGDGIVARLGGDEFVAVLTRGGGDTAGWQERIQRSFAAQGLDASIREVCGGASVGLLDARPGEPLVFALAEAAERMRAEKRHRKGE